MRGDGSSNEIEELRSLSGSAVGEVVQSQEAARKSWGFNTVAIKKSLDDRQPICNRSLCREGAGRSLRSRNIPTQVLGGAPWPVTRCVRLNPPALAQRTNVQNVETELADESGDLGLGAVIVSGNR